MWLDMNLQIFKKIDLHSLIVIQLLTNLMTICSVLQNYNNFNPADKLIECV